VATATGFPPEVGLYYSLAGRTIRRMRSS